MTSTARRGSKNDFEAGTKLNWVTPTSLKLGTGMPNLLSPIFLLPLPTV